MPDRLQRPDNVYRPAHVGHGLGGDGHRAQAARGLRGCGWRSVAGRTVGTGAGDASCRQRGSNAGAIQYSVHYQPESSLSLPKPTLRKNDSLSISSCIMLGTLSCAAHARVPS